MFRAIQMRRFAIIASLCRIEFRCRISLRFYGALKKRCSALHRALPWGATKENFSPHLVIAASQDHPQRIVANSTEIGGQKSGRNCDEDTPQNNSDSDSDSDVPDVKDATMTHKINEKSRKRQRWLDTLVEVHEFQPEILLKN